CCCENGPAYRPASRSFWILAATVAGSLVADLWLGGTKVVPMVGRPTSNPADCQPSASRGVGPSGSSAPVWGLAAVLVTVTVAAAPGAAVRVPFAVSPASSRQVEWDTRSLAGVLETD
ncbi:unnamed protein product, partial [Tilletia caries]